MICSAFDRNAGDARFTVKIHAPACNMNYTALYDTGASASLISCDVVDLLGLPVENIRRIRPLVSVSGEPIQIRGQVDVNFSLGKREYSHRLWAVEHMASDMILGREFQKRHRIGLNWSNNGKMQLTSTKRNQTEVIAVVEDPTKGKLITASQDYVVPPQSFLTITSFFYRNEGEKDKELYEIHALPTWHLNHPDLFLVNLHYPLEGERRHLLPLVFYNASETEDQTLKAHEPLCFLVKNEQLEFCDQDVIGKVQEVPNRHLHALPKTPAKSQFLTSPADIEMHEKPALRNYALTTSLQRDFEALCSTHTELFSKNANDIGQTKLIEMHIDTGDSPPLAQKPYMLPLKHVDWVKEQLNILEEAQVIERSVSPWASPIVVVPKKSLPGQPPEKRLCVDYRMLNSLLPMVKKAHSLAKGILSLIPLPKIDELYALLHGSTVFSTLDLRAGYHHIALDPESQKKSAFVTQFGKYEWKKVPFGLAQAPAYFQALMNETLAGLHFCFAYLDDVLIFSKTPEQHLQHLRIVFKRLQQADLKMRKEKCDFFKQEIQYLGHKISGKGIAPVKEKVVACEAIPPPSNQKEVRQFLGLTGYYRKFIPRYADVSRPLTQLTRKDIKFSWTSQTQKAFECLKEALLKEPILRYPDPQKPYVLFTDASKYAWAGVLTQEYEHKDKEGLTKQYNHPVTYVSGQFRGAQLNWATLTKEAAAIYNSVKKLSYYLEDAVTTVRSDHLPLKRFLQKNTLNSKVNNWAVEMETYVLQFEYIKGTKNTLADALSRLVSLEITQPNAPEPLDQEFGYKLPPRIEVVQEQELTNKFKTLVEQQGKDEGCKQIRAKMERTGNKGAYFLTQDGVLCKAVTFDNKTFEVFVTPRTLIPAVLYTAHDMLAHAGVTKVYDYIRRKYFWKGMKLLSKRYVQQCPKCFVHNVKLNKYPSLTFKPPRMPMQFLSMDLIGPFFPPTPRRNRFALTIIDMLTGFVWAFALQDKTAPEIVSTYLERVYSYFGGSQKILTDNGSEFKNQLFQEIADALGVKKIFTAPYHPESNGKIEGFHKFLKPCLSKYMCDRYSWDQLLHIVVGAYNFLPQCTTQESPFFLMFGRDPLLPLENFILPKPRYLGDEDGKIQLDLMRKAFALAAYNLRKQNLARPPPKPPDLTAGTAVVLKAHVKDTAWAPRLLHGWRIVSILGDSKVEIQDETGKSKVVHIRDIAPQPVVRSLVDNLPEPDLFGRASKHLFHPDQIPQIT